MAFPNGSHWAGTSRCPYGMIWSLRDEMKGRYTMAQFASEATTRTALVTGASRGLGLALARELARQGWALIIDARGMDALVAVHKELSRYTRVITIPGDVTDPAHRQDLVA